MARGKGNAGKTKSNPTQFATTFINIRIAVEDGPAIDELYGDADLVYDAFADLVASGHKVSFTYGTNNDSVIVAVTGREGCGPNEGLTYSSFAGDWYKALKVALYKHYVVAGKDWTTVSEAGTRPDFG